MEKDKNLRGSKLIEDAIDVMYQDMTDENLAKVVYVLRDRIKDSGHLIVAVKPGMNSLEPRTVKTPDGKSWFAAFTSFDEELKKKDDMVSGFTAEMTKLFGLALEADGIEGVIVNPWDKALKLNKELLELVL